MGRGWVSLEPALDRTWLAKAGMVSRRVVAVEDKSFMLLGGLWRDKRKGSMVGPGCSKLVLTPFGCCGLW